MALVLFAVRQKRTVFRCSKTVRLFYCFIIASSDQIGKPPVLYFSRPRIERIVFSQQIQAILIHTDSFSFGMFSQGFVQTFRNSQFELTRISVCTFGFGDFQSVLNSRLKPHSFGIFKICNRRFHSVSAGYTSDKLGIGCNVSAFIKIGNYFNLIR